MKILVACEESQVLCKAFRNRGHEAWSCDILPSSGGHPEWHIHGDVMAVIDRDWDMIIAFPPCTYLTLAGNRSFSLKCNSADKVAQRIQLRNKAVDFFMTFAEHPCPRVAVENPVGYINKVWRQPDQIIHPYYFGEPVLKKTCLWLKGLPKLSPTKMLPKPQELYVNQKNGKKVHWCEAVASRGSGIPRSQIRSKTFAGVAEAMADQWGM